MRALPRDGKEGATTAYRIYTIGPHGSRTLTSELADTNDREALRAVFDAVLRFPAQKIWLLECDTDDASGGESNARLH
jgi:hypothetical protein